MKSLAFIAASFLAAVNAASVTFKVVAPSASKSVQVSIDGTLTSLNATDPDIPYYVGTAEYNLGQSYKYVMDGKSEEFDRSLTSGDSTRNEFYNRNVTYADIPAIPQILTDGAWTKGDVSHPIWDTNYITTIFVTGKKDDMEDLIENVPTNTYSAKITYVGPDELYTFEDCTFGLHKPGRKNNDAKQTWVWALPENQFLGNRNWFKIRHMEEDPTQLREKLYADISRAMGTYANAANMVRLYINGEGMGTFNMLDDVIMYSYINAMFYAGNAPSQMGGLYDGGSGADFNPSTGYDNFIPNVASPLDQDAIGPFAKAISKVDFDNDAEVEAISQYFDYDQFLRFMVIEYLTGSWDGYWQEQTNDGAYIDVASEPTKLYYLAQDFDATFGVNLPFDSSFTKKTVPDYLKEFKGAYLVNKFLSNPKVNATFYSYLQTTYEQIFNTRVLEPIVLARHNFYWPDLEWDRSIKQQSPGNVFGWSAKQTYQNLYKAVSAPGGSGGGAEWGLLQWISEIENTCAKFFGNPTNSTLKDIGDVDDEKEQEEEDVELDDDEVEEDAVSPISAASVKKSVIMQQQQAATSGAAINYPRVLSAVAVMAVVASLF